MNQTQYSLHYWGPCVLKTKVDQNTQDLLLKEGEASKEDASPELAGVLNNQFHYRDKRKFDQFFASIFSLYAYAYSKWKDVRLTSSQVAIAKKLGVSLEEYAKQLKLTKEASI